MVEAILLDRKRVLPTCVYLDGEYSLNGIYMGVPCKLGADGVEQIIEIDLTDAERSELNRSANAMRELVEVTGL
jgi:malate dehydrogenase